MQIHDELVFGCYKELQEMIALIRNKMGKCLYIKCPHKSEYKARRRQLEMEQVKEPQLVWEL